MFKKIFLFFVVAIVSTSCDGIGTEPNDDHTDADGFILELNGEEVYKEFKGEITNNITLSTNQTLELAVHFLDGDGNEIEHEDHDDHDSHDDHDEEEDELDFDITDPSIISVEAEHHEEEEEHEGEEEEHGLAFELTGLAAGATTFTMKLMHGTHADYTSFPISVQVD